MANLTDKRIAVLGTGANGAAIAADIHRAGYDVVLIDQWAEHVEAMRENGVRVEMAHETQVTKVRAYHLSDVATFDALFDIVLLVIKAYDTPWACHLIKPCLAKEGVIAGVQNGMTVDAIADAVGPERTIGCVIEITSQMFEPGIIQRESGPDKSWFAVGAIDEAAKVKEEDVRELLSCAGTAVLSDDIRSSKWMKLISNCTTLATTAIFGATMADAAADPKMRAVMLRAGEECLLAGQEVGYKIQPIFGLSAEELEQRNDLVDFMLDHMTGTFITPTTITTILQDHMKNRRSEVGDVNGWVVEAREAAGATARVNKVVVELAGRIKRGELEARPGNVELVWELVGEG